jgi:MFS family permease
MAEPLGKVTIERPSLVRLARTMQQNHLCTVFTGDGIGDQPSLSMRGVDMRAAGGSDNLWHYRDFLKLWAGESISLVGSQVTTLALPLTAVLTLGASGFEVALLTAATWAPYLLVTLLAGVWVDRLRRLPLLIGANAGRALLLATIPLAHLLGALRLELLLVVAFLTGALTVVFNLSYRSYLPTLVGREHHALEQVVGRGGARN